MKSKIVFKDSKIINLEDVTNFFYDERNNIDYVTISCADGKIKEYQLDTIETLSLNPNTLI